MEENKAPKRELTRLEKRYKSLRWAQYILFFVSVIVAVVPATVAVFNTGLVYTAAENDGGKWSLAAYAIFVVSVGVVLMAKGLIGKFKDKLPWATTAVIGTWIMTAFIFAIKAIVEDAFFISFMLAIGCTVAAVLSGISDLCKAQADVMREEYNRRQQ